MSYNENNEPLYFEGNQRGVILLHAYTGSPNDVRSLGRSLNAAGYSVCLPTFSGHATEQPENILAQGPEIWAQDVKKSLDFMKAKGIKQIAIFGLSLGGVYATVSLAKYPEILIGGGAFCSPLTPTTKNNISPVFLNYAKTLIQKHSQSDLEVRRRMENIEYQLTKQLKEINELQAEVTYSLAEIIQPYFFAQGDLDQLVDPAAIATTVSLFTATQPQVHHYPKSGHVVTVGPEKLQFQEDVLAFVNSLDWTRSE
ncbi:alpha/beta hydrolase [Vagococcus zengguangii]|uniref:Alpha/beta fold hydrolase n=1 Tax=Vagococcus zengguangii TaxID=2571750 RepID=A0A4D7CT28_9ENTE|nr:alpha/beta fold hydrolase [Vagococcus zengguangii]QCI86164.1 alpha/beta fold hydrolase [Vagococcus zengguangii]